MEVMQKPRRQKVKKKREPEPEEEEPQTTAVVVVQQEDEGKQQQEASVKQQDSIEEQQAKPPVDDVVVRENQTPDVNIDTTYGGLHMLLGANNPITTETEEDFSVEPIYPSLAFDEPQETIHIDTTQPEPLQYSPQTTTTPIFSPALTHLDFTATHDHEPEPTATTTTTTTTTTATTKVTSPQTTSPVTVPRSVQEVSSSAPSTKGLHKPPSVSYFAPMTQAASPMIASSAPVFKVEPQTRAVSPSVMEAPPTYVYNTTLSYQNLFAYAGQETKFTPEYTALYPAAVQQQQAIRSNEVNFFNPLKVASEFFNMLKRYYQAQSVLDEIEPYSHDLRERCQYAQVWNFVEQSRAIEAPCRDNQRVSHTFSWRLGTMDNNVYEQLKRDLDELRALCGETLTDKIFEAQMSKLLVEIYIDDFLWHSQFDDNLRVGLDSSAPTEPLFESNHHGDFSKLEHMVDVLFCFAFSFHSHTLFPPKSRYMDLFCDDVKKWLQVLAGVYLRVCTINDDIRLLKHVLNCPGIGEWGAHVVHFTDEWNYSQAEHFLNMLAMFLSPSPQIPPTFLAELGTELLGTPAPSQQSQSRPLQPSASSHSISPVSNQPPSIPNPSPQPQKREVSSDIDENWAVVPANADPARPAIDPQRQQAPPAKSNSTPKLLLREEDYAAVLEQFPFFTFYKFIFDVRDYYLPQDTAYSFETAKKIVTILSEALDTFSHYAHVAKILSSCIARVLNFADIYYIHRRENLRDSAPELENYYYELFATVVSIFVSKGVKNGIWQFLCNLPYSSLGQTASLNVLSLLVGRTSSAPRIVSKRQWDEVMTDKSIVENFGVTLSSYEGTEYLLHAVSAWGLSSDNAAAMAAQDVITIVGYVLPQTKAKFYKTAREMIVGLCDKVSGAISDNLMPLVSSYFAQLGKQYLIHLFKGLPWNDFCPSTNDIFILKSWLLQPMKSDQFLAANFVLEHVNWGLANTRKGVPWWEQTDSRLHVYAAMQRECALMLVEVWEAHTKKNQGLFGPGSKEKEEIDSWCIAKLLNLNFYAPTGGPYLEQMQISDARLVDMRKYYEQPNLQVPTVIGYTLIMTVGLTFKGLAILKGMVQAQQHAVVLRILHDVIPDLVAQNAAIVHEIGPIVEIVMELIKPQGSIFGPAAPKISPTALQLAALIVIQLFVNVPNQSREHNGELAMGIAKFWLSVLMAAPQWIKDESCKHVINRVLGTTFYLKIPVNFGDLLTSTRSTGNFSAWATSSAARPSSYAAEFVWLAYEVLFVEAAMEVNSNTSVLKEPITYEMLKCILSLPYENIIAPLFLQLFFSVFCEEVTHKDPKMHPTKILNPKSSTRKSLLDHLEKLMHYHQNPTPKTPDTSGTSKHLSVKISPTSPIPPPHDSPPISDPVVPHAVLAKIYHLMFTTWLSPSSPNEIAMFKAQPHLIDNIQDKEAAARLRTVMHKSPFVVPNRSTCWTDLVDLFFLRNTYVSNYARHYPNNFGEATSIPQKPMPRRRPVDLLDEFKNAPPALINRPLVSPISLMSDEMESSVKKTISSVGFFAHKYMDRLGLHTTLDKHYLDLLPALYTSNQQNLYFEKGCSPRCSGKAIFTVPATPAIMDERISTAIQQNRDQILPYIENPSISTELCANMIFLQCMGNKFMTHFSTFSQESQKKAKLVDTAMEVFFHLVNTCDERPMLIYPPARKTLRPLIRDLAGKFVGLHPEFSSRFLGCIVSHPERVLWLHPYWQPVFSNFDELVDLITRHYLRVQHIDTERLVMPLLHKFDFIQWLQMAPTVAQVRRVISILGKGIAAPNGTKFSSHLTSNPGWMFIHNAFKLVCGHKIFEAYLDILPILLEHSKGMSLPPEVWWGFLELPLQQYLSETQIMATFESLTTFFWSMRASKQHNLYTTLNPYISAFVGLTKKLLSAPFSQSNPLFAGNGIMEVYEPWVSRMDANSQPITNEQFPWVPQQNADAHLVVTGLVECISVLLDAYPQTFDNFMVFFLTKMAPHRTPEILELPWYKWFIPTNSLLMLLNTIRGIPASTNNYLPGSGEPPTNPLPFLLCEIIAMIDWSIAFSRSENQLEFLVSFVRLIIFAVYEHPNPFESKFGQFLKQIQNFDWTPLTPQSYEQLVADCMAIVQKYQQSTQSFSSAKTPKGRNIEFQKWTYILALLRCVACAESVKQDAQQIINVSWKLSGFIEVLVYLLGLPQFEYWKAHDPLPFVHDLMNLMKVRFKLLVPFPEGVPCISKTLRTFLAINNSPVIHERLANATAISCDLLREIPYLAIEFLQAAQQTIFAMHSLSQLVEHSLEVYFGLFVPPGPAIDALAVPELENKEFVADCVKHGFSFTLYIYCLQQITRKAPLKMLCASVWEWETYIPVDNLGEKCYKILPLWAKSAALIFYLFKETNDKRLLEQANSLAGKIYKFGEAKKSDGFLGAIGLGEKSALPPAFRYICKALSLFIHLQASPSDNAFAFRTHQPHLPLTRFHKFLPYLEKNFAFVTSGVLREREYAGVVGMAQAVATIGRFIGDESKTMQDVEAFVGCLGEVMYPNAKVFIHLKG